LFNSTAFSDFFNLPKNKTSFVWDFFGDATGPGSPAGTRVRKCKKCPYTYTSKTYTTTAMVNHLPAAHRIVQEQDAFQRTESETQSSPRYGTVKIQFKICY
jgi:hypothetical protein